jgi:hypothetical protein
MTNIKRLLYQGSPNEIFLTTAFKEKSSARNDFYGYKKSGWVEALGYGAFIKKNGVPTLLAGINALQYKADYKIHSGGRYALEQYHGKTHFVRHDDLPELFCSERKPLPKWFEANFAETFKLFRTRFLSDDIGLQEIKEDGLKIEVSTPERAFLEMLYTGSVSTVEAYQIMETMTVVKPDLLNEMLSCCASIKVKRLFLYLASKVGYAWFKKLDLDRINLGRGVRVIDKSGHFHKEWNIVADDVKEE